MGDRKLTLTIDRQSQDNQKNQRKGIVHKSHGVRSGLGICAFVAELLRANEAAMRDQKATDDELREIIIGEFPHRLAKKRSSVKRLYRRAIGVWYYRGLFNAGLLDGQKPKERSQPYNEEGQVIAKTRGRPAKTNRGVGQLLEERKRRDDGNHLSGKTPSCEVDAAS